MLEFISKKRAATLLVLTGVMAALSMAGALQAQVYFSGGPESNPPPVPSDFDPVFLNSFTEESGAVGEKVRRSDGNCGGDNCTGILFHRFANPRITPGTGGGDSMLTVDYQIRVGQPAGEADPASINENNKPDSLGNVLSDLVMYAHYGAAAFGTDRFDAGTCTTDNTDLGTRFNFTTSAPNGRNFDENILAFTYVNQFAANGPAGPSFIPNFTPYVVPSDSNDLAVVISCTFSDDAAPANIAFHSQMFNLNSQLTGPDLKEQFTSVAENNLWYYPLDGNPAIIDLEVSGGGENFYIDVTFSEGVANANGDGVGMAEFEGAVHIVSRTAAYADDRGQASTLRSVTKPGGGAPEAGDTVIRLQFEQDPIATLDATLAAEPNLLFSVEPGAGITVPQVGVGNPIVADDDAAALHKGEDWWVRAWFDHRAPYITTAEVGVGNQNIDVTFNEGVKFEVSFNDSDQAVMTGTAAPTPEDFVIRHYDKSADTVTDYAPANVTGFDGSPITVAASAGVREVRLGMPAAILADIGPGDTVDVRTAQRQKDPLHPGLASVFVYGADNLGGPTDTANAEHRKNSRYATSVGDTNYPRTAAFAQAGSLPFKRDLSLTFDPSDSQIVPIGRMANVNLVVGGEGLVTGETINVTLSINPSVAGVSITNPTVQLTAAAPTVQVMIDASAATGAINDTSAMLQATVSSLDGVTGVEASDFPVISVTLEFRTAIPIEVIFVESDVTVPRGGSKMVEAYLDGTLPSNVRNLQVTFEADDPAQRGVSDLTVGTLSLTNANDSAENAASFTISANDVPAVAGVGYGTRNNQESDLSNPPSGELPGVFIESDLTVHIVPSFDFNDAEFPAIIAAGGQEVQGAMDEHVLIPGGNVRTRVNTDAPLKDAEGVINATGMVYVCARESGTTGCSASGDFSLLNTNGEDGVAFLAVESYSRDLIWAGIDGTSDTVIPVETRTVYIAPPVGFEDAVLVYDGDGTGAIDVPLRVAASGDVTALSLDVTVNGGDDVTGGAPDADGLITYTAERTEKTLAITGVNGIMFDSTGYASSSTSTLEELVGNEELFSIGNSQSRHVAAVTPEDDLVLTDGSGANLPAEMASGDSISFMIPAESVEGATAEILRYRPVVEMEEESTVRFVAASEFESISEEVTFAANGAATVMYDADAAGASPIFQAGDVVEIRVSSGGAEAIAKIGITSGTPETGRIEGVYARAQLELNLVTEITETLTARNDGIADLGGVPLAELAPKAVDFRFTGLTPAGKVMTESVMFDTGTSEEGHGLHLYFSDAGWQRFVEGDAASDDKVYSAPEPCPAIVASRQTGEEYMNEAWRAAVDGAQVGDKCVLVQIRDGSVNDGDMTANGTVNTPKALSRLARGGSGGGGGAIEPLWLVLLAAGLLLSGVGLRRRKARLPISVRK